MKAKQTNLWKEINIDSIIINPGSEVECFSSKKRGIVIEIYEENIWGRVPARVVDLKTGREMMPFIDECKLIKPYFGQAHQSDFEISDETAARFRAYAEAR